MVSDHTRTSGEQQSTGFNNSQSSFAGFGNSMSSFGGASVLPLQSTSFHGMAGGSMRNSNQAYGNFAMMSQLGIPSSSYHGGMSHQSLASTQRQLHGNGGNAGIPSATYHGGMMRPPGMSQHQSQQSSGLSSFSHHQGGMLQQETINEHDHQDHDYDDSFAFPQGEGFLDKTDG